jgi:integrase/recombinase XerD
MASKVGEGAVLDDEPVGVLADDRGLHVGRSPDTATSEDLRRVQLHMAQQQVGAASINAAIAALRFFFTVTLERPDLVRPLRIVNEPRRAPVVLTAR